MIKGMKYLLAFAALMLCGGAWAVEQVLVSDTHLTTTDWVDTNWTVDSLDELITYSYYGTMAGGSIADGNVAARGYFVRKEGLIVTVQMQVHQNKGSGNNYLKVAKLALTLDDDKHVLVKGVAAGYISGGPICTEIVNWNGTFGSAGYGVNNLKADKLPLALSKPGLKMWLDASDSSTITLNEENKVTKWIDKSGHFQDATPSAAYIKIDGTLTDVTRYASVETVNGNAAIQMGEVASGIDLAFPQMTDIRTVFWVMDIKRNGNAFFLADNTANIYHFHRNVNTYLNGDASDNLRSGTWKCDGLVVKPQNDQTPTGHHVYSVVTTGNVTANSLSQDRQVTDQRNGGRAISELIVFNRALSAAEVAEVEDYLANKWTIVQSTEETVTNLAEDGSTTWGSIGTKANVTLNVTGNASLGIGGTKSLDGRFMINVAPGKKLTIYNNGNTGIVNAGIGVYITGGGTVETPTFNTLGNTPRVYVEKGSTWTINNGSSTVDAQNSDLSRIQGEGTIELIGSDWVGFPKTAANMFAATLNVKANNTKGVVCANPGTTEIGTLSGANNLRTDLQTGNDRVIRVLQSEDSTWSGKFTNDRLSTLKIAGYPGATSKTLTLTATFTENDNLEVEASGSVKLNGTWKGTTETILGEFGGSGSITDATTITVNNGAKIRADWGAVTANVAPTFASGAVIEVVTESIPDNNKIKLFSGSGFTASENVAKARILSTTGEVLSFGTVSVEADGVYAIASAETKNPTLYYGYAMTGSVNNMIVKEEDASNQLTKGGNFATGDFSDGKLNLGTNAGNHYGTNGAYPQGDFTFITLVKTPSSINKTIFAFGGRKNTSGLVGLRYAGNDRVCLFTGGSLDLTEVRALDSANTFHVYTIKYSKSTGMIQMSVDKGPYTKPVAFTIGSSGDWQFGGIHSGQIDGFAENANGGQMGEFRVYASELTDAERDAFVDEFATPVAKIGDEKYFSLGEACEAAEQLSEKVTITLLGNTSESVKLAANTTLDPGNYTYSGILMGSGTYILAYAGTTQPSAPSGVATKVWTGTVWIKGDGSNGNIDGLNAANYSNTDSKLAFTGCDGYFSCYSDGEVTAKEVKLIDEGSLKALSISNGSSTKGFLIKKLTGSGTLTNRDSDPNKRGISIEDMSEFEGSIDANNRAAIRLGTASKSSGTAGTIMVEGAALLANGKSWTASNGITIKSSGVIKGSGTIKSATTFEDGATIDLSKGAMTLEAVANFVDDGTLKVKGANLAGSKLFTVPAEQKDSPDYVKLIVDEEEIIGVAYQESATDIYVAKAVATISGAAFRTIEDALEKIARLQQQQPSHNWSISNIEVLDSSAVTNPYYTVVDGHLAFAPAIAKIDEDRQYPTLALALSAATSGDTVTLLSACAENVTIRANVTVETTNTAAFAGTINGEGIVVYNANKTKTDPTFTLGSTWTGTVWVKNWGTYRASDNLGNDNAAFIANMGRSGSTLKLSGVTGWYTGNEITFDICLENGEDDRAFGWENSSGSSTGESVFKSFTGSGLYRDTFGCTQKILIKDVSKFFGSFSLTGKRVTLGGTTQQADANNQIFVAAGATVMLDQASTWTASGGIKIAGTIGGSGILASATTFSDGATIDVSEGVLTATAPVSFAETIKVSGVTNDGGKVLNAHGLSGVVEVQNDSGEKLGYLAETAEGLVLTTSEPTDHYDLTADEVTELNLAAMTTGEIKYYTAQGVILAQNATINFPEGETGYYAWTAGGPEVFIAKKTKSVSIKMNPRRAGEGHIAATDDSVGGFPVAGVFWNHTKDYANNGAGTTELMTGIKDGTGATLSDTKVYYYMPNSYTVNKTDNAGNAIINGRDKQITGNGKLTFSYFDDTGRTTPSSWPYTVLTDNGTPYTIPRTPAASESAVANLGWCVAIQGMPYQVFDLYIYQASDQTAESITLLPIAVKANNGEWQYFAGDNKGSTIKTTINATWDGAPYCDSKEMTEGKNYIRYRISRATLGLADSEEIETIYLSHPSRSTYAGRLGLAGIQIVEVENDGFYNRKADADNQDGEGHVKTNWTEAQTWLNSSGSPINWPTTKETAYVNINADTVAEITVNDKITADMVTVKNAADAQGASFKFLTLEPLGEVATEKEDAPYILNAPVDATGFHGDLYLQSRISGLVTLNSGVTVNFVSDVADAETTAYPYTFAGAINPIKKNGPGSFLVPSSMYKDPFNIQEGLIRYDNEESATLSGVLSGTGKVVKSGTGTLTMNVANTFTGGTIINGGTVVLGAQNALGGSGKVVAVNNGGALDVNGKENHGLVLTLNGGTLKNSGTSVDRGNVQFNKITLDKDSVADLAANTGIIYSGWNATTLTLNNHTLTKRGVGDLLLCNVTADTGTIRIENGGIHVTGKNANYSDGNSNLSNVSLEIVGEGTQFKGNFAQTYKNLTFVENGSITQADGSTSTITITGKISGSSSIPNLTLADDATVETTSGITVTGALTLSTSLKVKAVVDTTVFTLGDDVQAPASLPSVVLVDEDGTEHATGYHLHQYGRAIKVIADRAQAGDVYATNHDWDTFKLANGRLTELLEGDVVVIKYSVFEDSQRWNIPAGAAAISGHNVKVDFADDSSNNAATISGDVANKTITVATGTVLFLRGNQTIGTDVTFEAEGTGQMKVTAGVTISGTVTITAPLTVTDSDNGEVSEGRFTLSEGAKLTVPAAFDANRIVSGVRGKSVAVNKIGDKAIYTLWDGETAPAIDIPEGTTSVQIVPGQTVSYEGDAAPATITIVAPISNDGTTVDITQYFDITNTGGAITVTLKDNETTQPAVTTMAAPTEEETDKVQFTITNPIPGLFYAVSTCDEPNGTFAAPEGVVGDQATSAASKTVSIPMQFTEGKKVKYYKVSVKATK